MKDILTYALGVAVCSGLFIGFYRLMLHQRVSFRTARIYLIASIVISAIIPAFDIPVWKTEPIEIPLLTMDFQAHTQSYETATVVNMPVDYWRIVTWTVYGIGIFALLAIILYQSAKIRRMKRRAQVHSANGYEIAVSSEIRSPFSFLSTIYVDNATPPDELRQIVLHESSHIRHRHSAEKIVMELLKTFMWFNPFAWIASRLQNEVHEFEADSDVLQGGCTVDEYLPVIFKQVFGYIPEISTGLANSLTKKRFEMMTRKLKHHRYSWLRTAGVLPIAAGMLVLFGFTHRAPEIIDQQPETKNTLPYITDDQGEKIWYVTDEMPKFQGNGDLNTFRQWVMESLIYPREAMQNNITGRVTTKFIVEKDGSVSNIEILSSPHQVLSDEVVRIVGSSPAWTPGKQDGKLVRVYYVLPVDFKLQGDGQATASNNRGVTGYGSMNEDIAMKARAGKTAQVNQEDIDRLSQPGGKAFVWIYGNPPYEIPHKDISKLDPDKIESYWIFMDDYPDEMLKAMGGRKFDAAILLKPKYVSEGLKDAISAPQASDMDEVVVVGYGAIQKTGVQTSTALPDSLKGNVLRLNSGGKGNPPFVWLANEKREFPGDMNSIDVKTIKSLSVLKNSSNYPEDIRNAMGNRKFDGVIIIEQNEPQSPLKIQAPDLSAYNGQAIVVTSRNTDHGKAPAASARKTDMTGTPFIWLNGSPPREISRTEMEKLDPNTIESVSVLKNSPWPQEISAAMGGRKFNGVIIITLKGEPQAAAFEKAPFVWLAKEKREITVEDLNRMNPNDIESMDKYADGHFPAEVKQAMGSRKYLSCIIVTMKNGISGYRYVQETPNKSKETLKIRGIKGGTPFVWVDGNSKYEIPYKSIKELIDPDAVRAVTIYPVGNTNIPPEAVNAMGDRDFKQVVLLHIKKIKL